MPALISLYFYARRASTQLCSQISDNYKNNNAGSARTQNQGFLLFHHRKRPEDLGEREIASFISALI